MATRFIRYQTGSDSNDGASFANPLKTISGTTVGKVSAGDDVRIEKSPDPQSTTQTATWTNGSRLVTLAAPLTGTKTLFRGETQWTTSTGVTAVTGSNHFRGDTSTSQGITIAAAATTGKIAYVAVENGPLDLTDFTRISFYCLMGTTTMTANNLSIKLCTDTIGAVPVVSASLPALNVTNRWFCFTLDFGTSIGPGIQSIAIYMDVDIAPNQPLYFDQMIVCKAAGDPQAIDYHTLVGISSDPENLQWYRIRGWYQDMLTFGIESTAGTSSPTAIQQRAYFGDNYTGTLYKRETITIPSSVTGATAAVVTTFAFPQSGLAGNYIKYSGGWDPADSMQTQNGFTIFSPEHMEAGYFYNASSKSYIEIDRLGVCCANQGWRLSTCSHWLFRTLGYLGHCSTGFLTTGDCPDIVIEDLGVAHFCSAVAYNFTSMYRAVVTSQPDNIARSTGGNSYAIYINSCYDSRFDFSYLNIDNNYGTGVTVNNAARCRIGPFASVKNNTGYGLSLTGYNFEHTILGCPNASFNTYGIHFAAENVGCRVYDWDIHDNTTGSIYYICQGDNYLYNCAMDTPPLVFYQYFSGMLYSVKHNQVADSLKIHAYFGTVESDTGTVYGDAIRSIKCTSSSTTECTERSPLKAFTWQHQVEANRSYTFTVKARRNSTGINCKLLVRGYQLAGITQDYSATLSTLDTWSDVTIGPIVPTESGVIEINGHCWGASGFSGWFNQVSYTED